MTLSQNIEAKFVEINTMCMCPNGVILCDEHGVLYARICKLLSDNDDLKICKTDFIDDCPLLKMDIVEKD